MESARLWLLPSTVKRAVYVHDFQGKPFQILGGNPTQRDKVRFGMAHPASSLKWYLACLNRCLPLERLNMKLTGFCLAVVVVVAIMVTLFIPAAAGSLGSELSPLRPDRGASATMKALRSSLPAQATQPASQQSESSISFTVPEPVICLLLGITLIGLSGVVRHRQTRKNQSAVPSNRNLSDSPVTARVVKRSSSPTPQIGEFAMAQTPDGFKRSDR